MNNELSRRDFLTLVGIGGLSALVSGSGCTSTNATRIKSSERVLKEPEYNFDRLRIGDEEYFALPLPENMSARINGNSLDRQLLLSHYLVPTSDMKREYPLGRIFTEVNLSQLETIYVLANVERAGEGKVRLALKPTKTEITLPPRNEKTVLSKRKFGGVFGDNYVFLTTSDKIENAERLPAMFLANASTPKVTITTRNGVKTKEVTTEANQYVPVLGTLYNYVKEQEQEKAAQREKEQTERLIKEAEIKAKQNEKRRIDKLTEPTAVGSTK